MKISLSVWSDSAGTEEMAQLESKFPDILARQSSKKRSACQSKNPLGPHALHSNNEQT
jgi:hypothetical protein